MEAIAAIFFIVVALMGFGFVIFIHELGHYLFARWADVKVISFAIGFGPVLLRWRIGDENWELRALPFGGFVQMLGEDDPSIQPTGAKADSAAKPDAADATAAPEPAVPAGGKDPRSLDAKSGWWRMWVLLGGVLFNLISSAIILICLAFYGLPVLEPVVGDVVPQVETARGAVVKSPAAELGLRPGDRIVTMDGHPVRMFEDMAAAAMFNTGKVVTVTVERDGKTITLPEAGKPPVKIIYGNGNGGGTLGIRPPLGSRINEVSEDAPANGPRHGERVVAIAGMPVTGLTGQQINQKLQPYLGREVTLTLKDDRGSARESTIRYAGERISDSDDSQAGFAVRVSQVLADSGAAKAGLLPGDLIVAADGIQVCGASHFLALIRGKFDNGQPVALEVLRDDKIDAKVTLTVTGQRDDSGLIRMGARIEPVERGIIRYLPPGLNPQVNQGQSLLMKEGVKVGQVLLKVTPKVRSYQIDLATTAEERSPIPLSEESVDKLRKFERPGLVQRILNRITGNQPAPTLFERLSSAAVGTKPADARANHVYLDSADGLPVDLGVLGADGKTIADSLSPGDRVVALIPTHAGAKQVDGDKQAPGAKQVDSAQQAAGTGKVQYQLQVVRKVSGIRTLTLAVPSPGVAFDFVMVDVPYQLKSNGEAFTLVSDAAVNMIVKTVQMIPRFFQAPESGGIDATKTLSGPVGIFRVLKMKLENTGFDGFLKFVALVGLNLFVVNLLPLPITDGGQLVFLAIEKARGRPLSIGLRTWLAYGGIAIVISLMAFTVGLDVLRWIGLM